MKWNIGDMMGFAQCCEVTVDEVKINMVIDFTGEKESFDLKVSF